jgi:hypothetical protein
MVLFLTYLFNIVLLLFLFKNNLLRNNYNNLFLTKIEIYFYDAANHVLNSFINILNFFLKLSNKKIFRVEATCVLRCAWLSGKLLFLFFMRFLFYLGKQNYAIFILEYIN